MKTGLSFKQKLSIFLMALTLAMLVGAPAGMNQGARVARGAAEPMAIAVNWNSFAMFAMPDGLAAPEG